MKISRNFAQTVINKTRTVKNIVKESILHPKSHSFLSEEGKVISRVKASPEETGFRGLFNYFKKNYKLFKNFQK